jgi:hypothetical protein
MKRIVPESLKENCKKLQKEERRRLGGQKFRGKKMRPPAGGLLLRKSL